jgi:hypothetical protein
MWGSRFDTLTPNCATARLSASGRSIGTAAIAGKTIASHRNHLYSMIARANGQCSVTTCGKVLPR